MILQNKKTQQIYFPFFIYSLTHEINFNKLRHLKRVEKTLKQAYTEINFC